MAVLGMRGTGNFGPVEEPENWRQGILLYFPNGDAPLTAFLSKMREQPTDDPTFHWFEKGLPVQRGTIRGAGTSSGPADGSNVAAGSPDATNVYVTVQPDGYSGKDVTIFKAGFVVQNQTTEENLMVVSVDTTNNQIQLRRDVGGKFASNPAITSGAVGAGDALVVV